MPNIKLINATTRLTRKQAAHYLGLAEGTLAVWATTGRYNLPYYKIGRLVFYCRDDLDAFLEGHRVGEPLASAQGS